MDFLILSVHLLNDRVDIPLSSIRFSFTAVDGNCQANKLVGAKSR